MDRWSMKAQVAFSAERRRADNCCCDACFALGQVTALTYPITRFFDGRNISTKHREMWLCDECRAKLVHALADANAEGAERS